MAENIHIVAITSTGETIYGIVKDWDVRRWGVRWLCLELDGYAKSSHSFNLPTPRLLNPQYITSIGPNYSIGSTEEQKAKLLAVFDSLVPQD